VPVRVCRMVREEVVRKIPVRTCRMTYEERVESVPVRVCRMVEHQQTVRVSHVVEKRVPVTYSRWLPRTVVRRVALDPCGTMTSVPYVGPSTSTYPSAPYEAGSSLGAVQETGRPKIDADEDVPQASGDEEETDNSPVESDAEGQTPAPPVDIPEEDQPDV